MPPYRMFLRSATNRQDISTLRSHIFESFLSCMIFSRLVCHALLDNLMSLMQVNEQLKDGCIHKSAAKYKRSQPDY